MYDGSLTMVVVPALFPVESVGLKIVHVAPKLGRVAADAGTNGVLENPLHLPARYVSCKLVGLVVGDWDASQLISALPPSVHWSLAAPMALANVVNAAIACS